MKIKQYFCFHPSENIEVTCSINQETAESMIGTLKEIVTSFKITKKRGLEYLPSFTCVGNVTRIKCNKCDKYIYL